MGPLRGPSPLTRLPLRGCARARARAPGSNKLFQSLHRLKLTTTCAPPKPALLGRAPRHNFPTLTTHGMLQQPVSPLTCTNRIHHRSRRVPVSFSWNFELTPSSGTPHDEGRPRPRLPYATKCTGTLVYRFISSFTVLIEPRVVAHLAGAPHGTFRCYSRERDFEVSRRVY